MRVSLTDSIEARIDSIQTILRPSKSLNLNIKNVRMFWFFFSRNIVCFKIKCTKKIVFCYAIWQIKKKKNYILQNREIFYWSVKY